jgi:hypothetical protein
MSATPRSDAWEITPAALTPGLGPMLRIGARSVPTSQISGVVGSLDQDRGRRPALFLMCAFGLIAMVFLWGVVDVGWRTRFLLGAVVFGAIGLSAISDLLWNSTTGVYRVEVLLADGDSLRYATNDPAEQHRLLSMVARHVVRPAAANDTGEVDRARPRGAVPA